MEACLRPHARRSGEVGGCANSKQGTGYFVRNDFSTSRRPYNSFGKFIVFPISSCPDSARPHNDVCFYSVPAEGFLKGISPRQGFGRTDHPTDCLFACPSACPPACPPVRLSASLSVRPLACLSASPSAWLTWPPARWLALAAHSSTAKHLPAR